MSTRYNTGNPIESTDVRDMSDNAKNLDLFSNSSELSFDDRFGVERKTIQGMIAEFDAQILNMGFSRIGTFTAGATLTNPRQTLLWDTANGGDGQEYGWSGAFPKVVPPSSTPASTGGISVGAWMSRFDQELRIMVRESLRRSYAEAGYNLVDGSFEAGGALVNANDVLLQERTGKAFSGPAGVVSAGTDPTSGGFVGRSGFVRPYYSVLHGTVADIASGAFLAGSVVSVVDREFGLYEIMGSGWPVAANGWDVLAAGAGRVAVYRPGADGCRLEQIGLVVDTGVDQKPLITNALNNYDTINFPSGTVTVSPIWIPSRKTINLKNNTTILAKTGYIWSDCVLNIIEVTDVTINGNGGSVKMLRSEYPLQEVIDGNLINSEYRHCVKLSGASNVTINDLVGVDPGGDCFGIGHLVCTNIVLNRPVAINGRRQGISVINANGCWINSPRLYNTNGLPPEAGIDIEPNPISGYFNRGIFVNDVYSENNMGGAVLISPGLSAGYTTPVSVFVRGVHSKNDGKNANGAIRCVPGIAATVPCPGRITISDVVAESPASSGVFIGRWNNLAPHLRLENIVVSNVGSDPAQNFSVYKSGLVLRSEPRDTVGTAYGNFEVDGLEVWDNRDNAGLATTYAPIYINNANNANEQVAGIDIKNIRTYKSAAKWGSNTDYPMIITTTNLTNVDIDFGAYKVPTTASTIQPHAIGSVTYVTKNSTINLTPASQTRGSTYKFLVDAAVTLQIAKVGSDFIAGFNTATSGIRATQKGAYIELTASDDGTYWVVTSGNPTMWAAY